MSDIRIPSLVTGLVLAAVAAALAAGGAGLLWGDTQRDVHGYVTSDSQELRSGSAALVSENIDLEGGEWLVDGGLVGDVRLKADSESSEQVFVGVGRTEDVRDYLRDVGHTVVEDVGDGPFGADYREVSGDRRAMPPANAGIWTASASGAGEQTLDWQIDDGDWSVVVMNADGSPGVTAEVEAGARLPWLDEAGWIALGVAMLLGAGAVALLIAAFRRPSTGAGVPVPAAA